MDIRTISTVILVILIIIISLTLFYKKILIPMERFLEECDKLEQDIKSNDDEERQIKRLIELQKRSWHRATGARVHELFKMMEVKYKWTH